MSIEIDGQNGLIKFHDGTVQSTAGSPNLAPCFSVRASGSQSIPATTFTKISFNGIKQYDLTSAFNSATSRFLPTVAGYYQINSSVVKAVTTDSLVSIFVNGAEHKRGTQGQLGTVHVAGTVYLNGTTDYVEICVYSNTAASTEAFTSYFDGQLVRAA